MMQEMTPLVRRALGLCLQLHAGLNDAHGAPYASHPISVACRIPSRDERAIAAALLHDTVEDCGIDIAYLEEHGIDDVDVLSAVEALTRREGEPYAAYIDRVARDAIAPAVKLADLEDNLDESRGEMPKPTLGARYRIAMRALPVAVQASEFDEVAGIRACCSGAGSGEWLRVLGGQMPSSAMDLLRVLDGLDEADLSAVAGYAVSDPDVPPVLVVALCHMVRALDPSDLCRIVTAAAEDPMLLVNRRIAKSTETPLGDMLYMVMG